MFIYRTYIDLAFDSIEALRKELSGGEFSLENLIEVEHLVDNVYYYTTTRNQGYGRYKTFYGYFMLWKDMSAIFMGEYDHLITREEIDEMDF